MPSFILEAQAHTGATVETLRFATKTRVTSPSETPPNTIYEGRLLDAGQLSRAVFESGALFGSGSVSFGYFTLNNGDGALDGYLDYGWGRAFDLTYLAQDGGSIDGGETVLSGTLQGIDTTDAWKTIRLRVRDRLLDIAKPLLTLRYTGVVVANALEGPTSLAGVLKPIAYGSCFNVPATLVSSALRIYQVSKRAVASITMYEGGVTYVYDGDSTQAALLTASIAGGHYRTCLASGLFRIGSASKGIPITADVTEGAAGTNTAAKIAGRLLDEAGISAAQRDTASFDALHAAVPYDVGLFVNSEATTADLIAQVLNSVGAALVQTSAGLYRCVHIVAPTGTPVLDLTIRDLSTEAGLALVAAPSQEGSGVPAYSVIVNYGRNWRPMFDNDALGSVSDTRKQQLAAATQQVVATDAAVQARNPLAVQLTYDTLLALAPSANATAIADFLLGLFKVRRDRLQWPMPLDRAGEVELGDVVRVTLDRFGYDAGKLFRVLGRTDNFGKRTTTLHLWG